MKKETRLYMVITALIGLLVLMKFRALESHFGGFQAVDKAEAVHNLKTEFVGFKATETPVEIRIVKNKPLIQSVSANGVVKASREAEIKARVAGVVKQLNVREGDFVRKQSELLLIDDEVYRITYENKKEQFNKALYEYWVNMLGNKYSNVSQSERSPIRSRVIEEFRIAQGNANDVQVLEWIKNRSRREIIATKTGLNASRLELKKVEIDFRNTSVRAPIDGYVAELDTHTHGLVHQDQKVMKIVSLGTLVVEVNILEMEVPLIELGAKATIKLSAFPSDTFQGYVKTVSPVIDADNGTCRVRIEFYNQGRKVKPGMYAQVMIYTKSIPDKLLIPREALLIRDDRKVVFVYQGGRAKWRYVETLLGNDEFVEVISGLSEGDSLITSGHFHLAHNAKVAIVDY